MTGQEILDRLGQEFPDNTVCFNVAYWSRPGGRSSVEMNIYRSDCGLIDCTSVSNAIELLHRKLGDTVVSAIADDIQVLA